MVFFLVHEKIDCTKSFIDMFEPALLYLLFCTLNSVLNNRLWILCTQILLGPNAGISGVIPGIAPIAPGKV